MQILDTQTMALLSPVPFLARKDWNCGVTLLDVTLENSLCWRTLLHEALHSVSGGLTKQSYERYSLWEEAIVESMQRLMRPALLKHLEIDLDEQHFLEAEVNWRYNNAIEALNRIACECPQISAHDFFRHLLSTPLPDRPAAAFEWGRQFASNALQFKQVYAASCGILR